MTLKARSRPTAADYVLGSVDAEVEQFLDSLAR